MHVIIFYILHQHGPEDGSPGGGGGSGCLPTTTEARRQGAFFRCTRIFLVGRSYSRWWVVRADF